MMYAHPGFHITHRGGAASRHVLRLVCALLLLLVLLPQGRSATAKSVTANAAVHSSRLSATTSSAGGAILPTIRWAGEKTVLSMCLPGGVQAAYAPVRFTLQGGDPSQSSLIPVP